MDQKGNNIIKNSKKCEKFLIQGKEEYQERRDIKQAKKYWKKAVKMGSKEAVNNLGVLYQEIGKYSKAFSCFQIASQNGIISSFNNLGRMYLQGQWVHRDLNIAIEYFEKAIQENNHLLSFYSLGYIYVFGDDEFKNLNKAQYYLEKLPHHYLDSQFLLGIVYVYQMSVGNYHKQFEAIQAFKYSLSTGIYEASLSLGYLYLQNQEIEKAKKYYKIASEHGFSEGFSELGQISQAVGEFEKANSYFQQASEKGDPQSMFMIAQNYEKGQGVQQDIFQALKWYKKSAQHNYVPSLQRLDQIDE